MKKTLIAIGIIVIMVVSLTTVAFAAGVLKTPAEIIAGLTGKSVEEVTKARQDGNSYGEQAQAAGKLEEFQAARLEQYKLRLDQAVKDQKLTQAEADKLYENMKLRLENCDGSCDSQGSGMGRGLRDGTGSGFGQGGMRNGRGLGGYGQGTCMNGTQNS
jgi:hypothetical protein